LHRRLAEAPSALVRPLLVVAGDPLIEIALQLGDRAIDLLAERHTIELVENGLVEPLGDAIGLRALGLGAWMVDVLERQIEQGPRSRDRRPSLAITSPRGNLDLPRSFIPKPAQGPVILATCNSLHAMLPYPLPDSAPAGKVSSFSRLPERFMWPMSAPRD
jgi:hypothetical protein